MKKQAEKEQKEKEEREKAEKEKKEKEAAAAAAVKPIPTITITTPAEVKPRQAEAKPPTLSFAPPSTSSESVKSAASKQTSFFGPPPGASAPPFTLGNAPTLKSEDKPPAKSATPQPSTSGHTFITNSSSGLPAKPTAPLFGGVTTDNKAQQPKPQSAFSFPTPPKQANDPAVGNGRPAFSITSTSSQPLQASTMDGQKDGQGTTDSSGGSLLSRLAPPAQSAAQPQQPSFSFNKPAAPEAQKPSSVFGNTSTHAPSTFATAASTGATSKPKFDFGISNKPLSSFPAPAAPTSSLSGALGNSVAKPASTGLSFNFKVPAAPAGGTSGTSTGTTPPKFSFAAPSSGPAAGGTNTFMGSKASAPATAPQSNEAQTNPLSFGTTASFTPAFGTNPFGGIKDSAATSAGPQSSETQPKSSPFGATTSSSTSPFGTFGGSKGSTPAAASQSNELQNRTSAFSTTNSSSASPFGSFGAQSNDTVAKSAFAGFGNGTQGTSFGTNTGSGTMFGSGGTSNVFGNNGAVAKPAETPNTTLPWSSSTPAANTGEASKSTFSFGGQTVTPVSAMPAANGTSSPFSAVKFGETSTTLNTTPQAPQPFAAGQSLFGGTPAGTTRSAFGFATPPATNGTAATGGSGLFSNPSASTGQQQQ